MIVTSTKVNIIPARNVPVKIKYLYPTPIVQEGEFVINTNWRDKEVKANRSSLIPITFQKQQQS